MIKFIVILYDKNIVLRLFQILLLFIVINPCYSQLNGTNTIDPAGIDYTGNPGGVQGKNYTSFNNAVSALKSFGICGAVTFNVASGTYNEQVRIGFITGVSATQQITFQSADFDSNSVILTYSASYNSNNFVVKLSFARYVNFKAMTIRATGVNYGYAVAIDSFTESCAFSNNCIQTSVSNATSFVPIWFGSTYIQYITLKDNLITGGSTGIRINGNNLTPYSTQNLVEGNMIRDFINYGINASYQDGIKIRNNILQNSFASENVCGIYASDCNNNLEINSNYLNLNGSSTIYGIYSYFNTGTAILKSKIFNNFVTVGGVINGSHCGIYIYNCAYEELSFNSVNMYALSTSSRCIYISNGTAVTLRDNIFANTGGGYAIYVNTTSSLTTSNYNDLYSRGTYVGYWNSNVTNLAAWKTASGKDANSVSSDPMFYSQTDLHVNTTGVSNLGITVSGITNDIDGESRLPTPDIGADEFIYTANDAGVSAILSPLPPCPGSNTVSIKVKNYGTSALNSISIVWWVNGVLQGTSTYPLSSLPQYAEAVITVGTYVFNIGTAYDLKFRTSLPNGVADPNPKNDSLLYNHLRTGLSGIYTIGATSSNYSSFNAAVNDLVKSGLCGSVVFRVRAGSYNENINIPKIFGSSAGKTITFESFDLDSNSVDLYYSSSGPPDNYTVHLSGSGYVTFRLLKIRATGSFYSRVFVFTDGSNNNAVLNSILISSIGANTGNSCCIYNSPNSLDNFNTIRNNIIQGGFYGIYMYGISTSARENLNIIQHNTIKDFTNDGIILYYQNAPVISANLIQNYDNASISYGIFGYYIYDSLKITKNKILLNASDNNYGINLYFSLSSVTTPALVANNFISLTGNSTKTNYGICLTSPDYIHVLFNSINITTASGFNGRSLYLDGGSGITVKNNILANFGKGYSMYVDTFTAITSSDYNNLYTNGTVLGHWNADQPGLTAWKTASGLDNFSVSVDPVFLSPVDLHSCSRTLDSAAQFSISVKDDIDNESRNPNSPDIGADEFFVFQYDAVIVSLISPVPICAGTPGNIVVKLRNLGIDTIKTARIKWTVNSGSPTAMNYSGRLAGTKDTNIIIGTFTFLAGTTYNLKVWTDSINSFPDQNHQNDTLIQKTLKTAMAGTYTIGPTGRDYASFTSAITDLRSIGVCDSVLFVVDSGTYNDHIYIPPIPGASINHTISFQSAANDSNNTIISYAAQSPFDNYVVQLDGANYIRFKKIKMKSTATNNYGNVLVLRNNASNNIFKNNVLQSISVISGSAACIYLESATQNNYNCFDNNRIYFGIYGINISGPSISQLAKSNSICNNIISNTYFAGIFSIYQDSIDISKNTIFNWSGASYHYGISCYFNNNNSRIMANNLSLDVAWQSEGLYLENCTGTKSSPVLVANNMVNITGTANQPACGIYCYNGNYIKVFHNTVNILAGKATSNCMYFSCQSTGNSGNISVLNNIMTNTGSGCAINIDTAAVKLNYVSSCNYNDLYVTGTYLGKYGLTDIFGFSAWQSATGKDANSISLLPEYLSNTDLHLNNFNPLRVYNPLVEVNTDFDGEKRSTIKPVIGADENPSFSVNAGIMGIVSPGRANCEGILPITATVYNFGTNRLDSVYIDYFLNGVKKKSILFKTSLSYLANANVQISYDTFYANKNYDITIKSRLPNGINDPYPFDDGDSVMHIKLFPYPVITSVTHDTLCPGTLKVTSGNTHIFFWYDSITGELVSEDSIFATRSAPKTYLVQAGTPGNSNSLITTKSATGTEMGNMFDLKATAQDIVIDSFAIYTNAFIGTAVPVALYYKKGSCKGHERDSMSWTFVGIDTVWSNGVGKFTDVTLGHIKIKKGDSVGIYISTTDPVSMLNYVDGSTVYKDSNIRLSTGSIMFYRFDSFFQAGKSWDGIIYYSTGSLCKSQALAVKVLVNSIPLINLIHDSSICKGHSITLDAGAGVGLKYAWKYGTDNDTFSRNQIIHTDSAGKYRVIVMSQCGSASDSVNITSLPAPLVNLGHDTIINDDKNITLDAGSGFDKYSWSTGSTNRTITVDTTGIGLHSKSFSVVVFKNGCTGSDTILITFIKHNGIDLQNDFLIRIYPNPTGDEIQVEISGVSRQIFMVLSDMQGKAVQNIPAIPINGKIREKIDISGLSAGLYFLKISNEKLLKIEKVIKR